MKLPGAVDCSSTTGPGQAQVITEPVSLVDIAPTILEIAGVAVPPILDGKNLGPRSPPATLLTAAMC